MAYPSYINYIKNSEPVVSGVTNRPTGALDRRTDELKSRLDSAELGQALTLYDVTLSSATQVGMPVYWDTVENAFLPAYAQAEINSKTGDYKLSKTAICVGLVCKKESSVSGNILISGIMDLPEIANVMEDCQPGIMYLGTLPGTLTNEILGVSVPVGQVLGALGACDGKYRVKVSIEAPSPLTHSHFSVDLATSASTEADIPGWYPAAEDSNSPAGAVYAYRISADSALKSLFPPIPMYAVSCTMDWGDADETLGGKELPVNKLGSIVRITNTGLYWMTDAVSPINVTIPTSPRVFRITLNFSKVNYGARIGGVTSLQPDVDQLIRFVDCTGDEAMYGDLYAQLTINTEEIDVIPQDTPYDGKSMRRFNSHWKQEIVPVVNGFRSDSPQVHITGNNFFVTSTGSYYVGPVTLVVDSFLPDSELAPKILRLDSALEREYNRIQYVGFPYGRMSSVVGKLEIPANAAPSGTAMLFRLRLLLLAPEAGEFPALAFTVARIPRPATNSVTAVGLAHTALTCNTARTITNGGVAFEVESNDVNVEPGDTLIVTIKRNLPGDLESVYVTDAGIIRFNGIINIAS